MCHHNLFFSGPSGLSDVSMYPNLFAELIRRGYTDDEVAKIANGNIMRVFKRVEEVRIVAHDFYSLTYV